MEKIDIIFKEEDKFGGIIDRIHDIYRGFTYRKGYPPTLGMVSIKQFNVLTSNFFPMECRDVEDVPCVKVANLNIYRSPDLKDNELYIA